MTEPDPVAALAAQLEQLRGELSRYEGEVGQLRERLTAETSQTAMLRLEVKKQKERLAKAIGDRQLKPSPAPWLEFGTPETQALLAELREWVEGWLRPNFGSYLAKLPQCWTRHAEACWELATLQVEWVRIYDVEEEEDRDEQGALVFLDRFLPNTLARLAGAVKCNDIQGCQLAPPRRS